MRPVVFTPALLIAISVAAGAAGCGHFHSDPRSLDEQLISAAQNGDSVSIERLLRKGAHIDAKSKNDGMTALAVAAQFGHEDAVKLLLKRGADAKAGGITGKDALLEAAMSGNPAKAKILLDIDQPDLAAKNEALLTAVTTAPPLVIELSPEESKEIEQTKRGRPQQTSPPEFEYARTVQVLLDSGAGVEEKGWNGATPLIEAAEFAQTDTVKLLLERGASVDATDDDGATALIGAACSCAVIDMPYTLEAMKLLLERGANVEARDKNRGTALMRAAGWGRAEIIELLLDRGAHIDDTDSNGKTSLLIAASGNMYPTADAVKLLLARGANIEAKDNRGNTALLLTASGGGYEGEKITEILLARGANVRATNKQGTTALNLAQKNGQAGIAAILRKALKKSS